MLSFFLTLHIVGSLLFIGYVFIALWSLATARGSRTFLRNAALGIGAHQVVTGVLLGLLSPTMTMLAVCVRGLALVTVLYVLSYATHYRLTHAHQG